MAGARHHYIWQMIQRGFGQLEFNENHVWVFSKNERPRKTTTRKFGQEKNFFGEKGSLADSVLTDFENETQSYIQDSRMLPDMATLDSEVVAKILAMLEMRSQFIREEMSRVSVSAIEIISQEMFSKSNFSKLILSYLEKNPEIIDAKFDEVEVAPGSLAAMKSLFLESLPTLVENDSGRISKEMRRALQAFIPSIASLAREAHMKAIRAGFSETERTASHRALSYRVLRFAENDLILPDTGLAWIGDNIRPISEKASKFGEVIIPISSSVAIHGSRRDFLQRPNGVINRILASCSHVNFIAPEDNLANRKLTSRIGQNASIFNYQEIKTALRNLVL